MKICLCILETIKPLKVNLDSAMASKMKNINPQKSSLFLPQRWFSSNKNPWSLEKTKPLRQNSNIQIVMKYKNTNCEKNLKTQILTKLKNSNCDQTQKPKL